MCIENVCEAKDFEKVISAVQFYEAREIIRGRSIPKPHLDWKKKTAVC
jgi:hypothetical protein